MSLFTDNEGGNFRLISPNGIVWEIDAYNDNLRIFRYGDSSTGGSIRSIYIEKNGTFHAPFGISGLGYTNSIYGQIGCGAITFYGHVIAYSLVGTVILKIGGMVDERYSLSDTDFDLGINLSAVLDLLGLKPTFNVVTSHVEFFNSDGTFNNRIYGYGAFFSQRFADGQKILTPARFYTPSGGTGAWGSSAVVYSPGTVWIAEVVLK